MKVSYAWLQEFFDTPLPPPAALAEALTFRAFQVEGIEGEGKDAVLDIDVLPNRAPDCLSHRGIAREVGAALDLPVGRDPLRSPAELAPLSASLSVAVEDELLCRRYSAAVIRGVSVGPSPAWLAGRLAALGQRSINNIVDVANYVMFGLGQPLHAFDAARVEGGPEAPAIVVRRARAGERAETLEGDSHALREEDLVISDESGAVLGIAGVKGGASSGITETTKDIVVESANFDGAAIRRTSRRLGLLSDASRRFEARLAPELTAPALREAVELILAVAGGKLEGYADAYPRPRIPGRVGVSLAEVNGLLGTAFSKEDVAEALRRLGFPFEVLRPIERIVKLARTLAGAPYRYGASVSYDAPRAFDCSGFAAYLFREAGVAIPRMTIDQFLFGEEVAEDDLAPGDLVFSRTGKRGEAREFVRVADGARVSQQVVHDRSREFLPGTEVPGGISHCGVYLGEGEVAHAAGGKGVVIERLSESPSFSSPAGARRMIGGEERFVVTVPFERLDLRVPADLVEEIGRTIGYDRVADAPLPSGPPPKLNKRFAYAEKTRAALVSLGFSEVFTYSFTPEGEVAVANPVALDRPFLRSSLERGLRESVALTMRNAALLGLSDARVFEIGTVFSVSGERTALGVAVGATDGTRATEALAEAEAAIEKIFGASAARHRFARKENFLEFDFDALVGAAPEPARYDPPAPSAFVSFRKISPFPFILRDLALWVPAGTSAEEPRKVIEREGGELLVRVTLFDTFAKDGKISHAFRLVFQSREKTLTDAEASAVMEKISSSLRARGWQVR